MSTLRLHGPILQGYTYTLGAALATARVDAIKATIDANSKTGISSKQIAERKAARAADAVVAIEQLVQEAVQGQ